MTFGLVNANFSLPEWQAVKITFFAPWSYTRGIERGVKDVLFYHHIISWMEQQEQKNCMPDRIPTFDSQTAVH